MFFVAVAHSEDLDTESILQELAEQSAEALAGRTPQAALLFAAIDVDHEAVLADLVAKWPGLQVIGCSTDGEVSSLRGFCEDSVSLILFGSDTVKITAGLGRNASAGVGAACTQAVAMARTGTTSPPRFCIALPESLTISGQQVVELLQKGLGDDVPLFGGGAADQWRMKGTRQFFGSEVVTDSIPVLLFSGALHCAFSAASGWRPVGEPGLATRVEGPVVHEIDGRPALEFFRRFLGPSALPTPECPLAIIGSDGGIEYLRASNGFADEATGEILLAGDVPMGAMVQIAIASRDAILDGCRKSVEGAFAAYPRGRAPEAALVFSCAARKMLLGTRTAEEFGIVREVLGTEVAVCGFYGYGEIGPLAGASPAANYHNEAFVCLLMGS